MKYVPSIIKLSDIPLSEKAQEKMTGVPIESEVIRKGFVPKQMNLDPEKRTMKNYISTLDIDWEGEVLLPKGMDKAHFPGGVLWAHDYMSLPIGSSLWMDTDSKGIISETKIGTHPEAEAFYTAIFVDKIPMSTSVGFVRTEKAFKPGAGYFVQDEESNAQAWEKALKDWRKQYKGAYGKDAEGEPTIITTKWALLEYSMVPVPMNPGVNQDVRSKALIKKALDSGIVTEDAIEGYGFTDETEENKNDLKDALDEIIKRLDDIDERLFTIEETKDAAEVTVTVPDPPKAEKINLTKEELVALVQSTVKEAEKTYRKMKSGRMN